MILVSVPELAKRLRLSESSLRQRCRDGVIVAQKIGQTWGVSEEEALRLSKEFPLEPVADRREV